MARRASQFATYTKGELDPDLSERLDLEHYYDSLAKATNCVFHPQGGFSDRGGFALCSDADVVAQGSERRLRSRILPVPITADNLTALNGGLTTALADQDATTLFTSNPVTADQFVLVEIDLGTPQPVDLVDVIGFKCGTGKAEEAIAVEWFDGDPTSGVWRSFGDAIGVPARKALRTTSRTRRFGVTPGLTVTSRNLRVVAYGANGLGAISMAGLRVWREAPAAIGPVDVIEVARDKATTYQVVIYERGADIYRGQRYVASLPLPVAAQQVEELSFAGGFDTQVVFHEHVETQRLMRQGSDGEWDIAAAPFTNVPNLVESVVFTGSQDEVQSIAFAGVMAGDTVVLMLGDQQCLPFRFATGTLAADARAAIAALPGIVSAAAADLVVEVLTDSVLRVRFGGANGNRSWPLLTLVVLERPSLYLTTKIEQEGLLATGLYFSAQTGWPRCGAFVQQRLLVAGFRSAPTSWRFSMVPAIWDFSSGGSPLTADKGFGGALDVREIEIINEVFVGRHLQFFTEAGEWWAETRKLDATQPINMIRASSHGMRRGVPMLFADGATIYAQKGGRTLRDFLYADVEASYQAEPLSVLAPHVYSDVIDLAHKPARTVTDGNLIVSVNRDGTAAAVTLLRKQSVIAGAPWTTAGAFRSVMTSTDHNLYMVTERAGRMWLERQTPDTALDWATRLVASSPATSWSLPYLAGRTDVWAIADGDLAGPLTVSATGAIELPFPASEVTFGLEPDWLARGQVVRDKLQNAQPFRPPGRIYECEVSVRDTAGLTLGTNGGTHLPVVMTRSNGRHARGGPLQTETGGAPQLPMMQRLYTGDVVMQGLIGISHHPYWELRRPGPVPVHIKRMRVELADKGDHNG